MNNRTCILIILLFSVRLIADVISEEEGDLVSAEKPITVSTDSVVTVEYVESSDLSESQGGYFFCGVSGIIGTGYEYEYVGRKNHTPFFCFAIEYLHPDWEKVSVGGVFGLKLFTGENADNMRLFQFLLRTSYFFKAKPLHEKRLYFDIGVSRDNDDIKVLDVESATLDYIHYGEFETYSRFTSVTGGLGYVHTKEYRRDRAVGFYGEIQYLYRNTGLEKYEYTKWPIHLFTITSGLCLAF